MNWTFKLGNIVVPVDTGEEMKEIKVEGLEMTVTDLNLVDYLEILKAVPGIMKEIKAIVEEDVQTEPKLEGVAIPPQVIAFLNKQLKPTRTMDNPSLEEAANKVAKELTDIFFGGGKDKL